MCAVSRRRPPHLVPLVAAFGVVVGLATGCGAGFDAQARKVPGPQNGVNASSGQVRVLNAMVIAPEAETAQATGSTGIVLMSVANDGNSDEEITSVQTNAGTAEYVGPRSVPAGAILTFGAGSAPSVTVRDLDLLPGEEITVKVSFTNTDPVNLRTLVLPATGDYSSVTPSAEPTVTTTPSPSGSGGQTTSRNPIASPSTS